MHTLPSGFVDSISLPPSQLEACEDKLNEDPLENLLELQKYLHQKYTSEAKSINRLVTREIIEKRKAQGLTPYYPNPIYLGDIAKYIRPKDMDYKTYVRKSRGDLGFYFDYMNCKKGYLSKESNINYDFHDESRSILERLYLITLLSPSISSVIS